MVTKEELDKYLEAYSHGTPLISDETYDMLLEEYLKEHGESNRPFLRSKQSDSINEIVGTLTKVYGTTTPMRPDQLVYADWLRNKKIPDDKDIIVQPKFDGCSVALDLRTNKFFTRGDVDNGESVDVTDLFESHLELMNYDINIQSVKFEAIMSHEIFKELGLNKTYKRPRDAVSGTITSRNYEISKYITLVPLRTYDGEHEYIAHELVDISLSLEANDFNSIDDFITDKLDDGACVKINNMHYSIDGVVVSTIEEYGNTGNEVAIKILNEVHETKLKYVEFQFGKTGKITPVAVFEPVKFCDDKITVDHATLSTLSRIVELSLSHDDTIRVAYNIVPYLLDTLHDGTYPIKLPDRCPICDMPLNYKTLKTVRCVNPKCNGLKIGLTQRYCEIMKMVGISKGTITKLFDAGLLNNISDIYDLTIESIQTVDGYKEKSAINIVKSITVNSTNVPIERWLGSLPIKDISTKTWKNIIDTRFNGSNMIAGNAIKEIFANGNPERFMNEIIPPYCYGVSMNTLKSIQEGLMLYWDDIKRLCECVTFDTLDKQIPTKGRVTLTGTRDSKLIQYLESKGYEVNDFSSKTSILIIPDTSFTSAKVIKAKDMAIPIYTINDAYNVL